MIRPEATDAACSCATAGGAVVIGVVFYWQLRELLAGGAGARSLATMAFGGALLFAASGTMSAGIDWAMQDQAHHASGATEQTLSAMAST